MKRGKLFDYGFLVLGLLIQVVTYVITNHSPSSLHLSPLSLIAGLLGICSVCLSAQGNILMYAFGFAQVLTFTWLCIEQHFYGTIAINAYYFVTMIYGVFAWRKRLGVTSQESSVRTVVPRTLPLWMLALIAAATLLVSGLVGWGLAVWTDDTQPYLDAYTTVPALVAQVLMILVYREHWFLWLAVDILSVVLWLRAGDYCMTAQYIFWCANCLYGLRRWKALKG
jgi:nicotinamide mononucleotide transporter